MALDKNQGTPVSLHAKTCSLFHKCIIYTNNNVTSSKHFPHNWSLARDTYRWWTAEMIYFCFDMPGQCVEQCNCQRFDRLWCSCDLIVKNLDLPKPCFSTNGLGHFETIIQCSEYQYIDIYMPLSSLIEHIPTELYQQLPYMIYWWKGSPQLI